jgi:hypothetical protein
MVDGPCDERVGGESRAVLCVEVGDLEAGNVTLGSKEVFVVRLLFASANESNSE